AGWPPRDLLAVAALHAWRRRAARARAFLRDGRAARRGAGRAGTAVSRFPSVRGGGLSASAGPRGGQQREAADRLGPMSDSWSAPAAAVGRGTLNTVATFGRFGGFVAGSIGAIRDVRTWAPVLPAQLARLGVESLPIALFIAAFTGIV